MVWEPGEDCPRLNIGQLEKGHQFWMIEDMRIANIKEMVAEIRRAQLTPWRDDQPNLRDPPQAVRVVYLKRRGSNTQYLTLSRTDVDELRNLAESPGLSLQEIAARSGSLPVAP